MDERDLGVSRGSFPFLCGYVAVLREAVNHWPTMIYVITAGCLFGIVLVWVFADYKEEQLND